MTHVDLVRKVEDRHGSLEQRARVERHGAIDDDYVELDLRSQDLSSHLCASASAQRGLRRAVASQGIHWTVERLAILLSVSEPRSSLYTFTPSIWGMDRGSRTHAITSHPFAR